MYTHDEVYNSTLEYFNNNELATNVFINKYALKDNEGNFLEKTPDDMHRRLSKEFARIEKKKFKEPMSEKDIYEYLKNFEKIIPGGSPLYGIGNNYKYVSLSNCFVVDIHDSIGGIFNTDEEMAHIFKRRGGCGTDISKLRPKDTYVSNSAGTTTGAISFLHRFDHTGKEIGQNGRRSAQLISLSVHHPDIEEFIDIKNQEGKVNSANISVRLTDEFLNAVENNVDYELRWPVNSDTPEISKTISAKKIWNKIVYSAWNMAEPGLLFWDNIINESPSDCYKNEGYETISTNPCMPSWATILTKNGIRQFKDVDIGDQIWSVDEWTTITNKLYTGKQDVFKYTTTAGIFYGTQDHKVVINKHNEKEKVDNAECINILTGPEPDNVKIDPQIVMDGLVLGDGSIHKASNNIIGLYIGDDDQSYFRSEVKPLILKHRPSIHEKFYEIKTNLSYTDLVYTYNRKIPDNIIYGDINTKCSFLRGVYSANGSICGNRITLKSTSLKLIEQVQLLLSSIGIKSYKTTNKATVVQFSNGKYKCKQSYDLNISTDRDKFVNYIGFIQEYKNRKIKMVKGKSKNNYEIIKKEYISTEDVWDITVDNKTHTYWTGGCNVSNCSEIPLSSYDSCRLLSINLFSCVDNPYTDKSKFNFKKLSKLSNIAQRFMDNIVDLESEKIKKIIKKVENDPEPSHVKQTELRLWKQILKTNDEGRRTGVGVTACGDVLAALKLQYGSEDSVDIIGEIYKTLKLGCYRSSVDMAKEIEAFKFYNSKKEENNPFIQRIKDEDPQLYKDMCQHGRRNIACLTTAPTGSISTQAKIGDFFGTTSGIEPCFMTSYKRRKRINQSDKNVEGKFTDSLGETWAEFEVKHSGLAHWLKENPDKDINSSPYYNSCASDIDWINRVKLQSAAQKHIDHAISSTINLPKDISQKEVANIYEAAWKYGLKGITVYREGCRSGILVSNEEEKVTPEERPKELPCDVHHITIRNQQYFILVGLLDGKPYEVFAGRNGFLPKKVKTGTIIRKRKDFYKVIFNESDEELSPITASTDEMEEVITRLTSGLLRVGTDMNFIVQQLEKVGEKQTEMHSFARSVSRALKRYIEDGTKIDGTCPECGAESLIRQEGCRICGSCGFSKCL